MPTDELHILAIGVLLGVMIGAAAVVGLCVVTG